MLFLICITPILVIPFLLWLFQSKAFLESKVGRRICILRVFCDVNRTILACDSHDSSSLLASADSLCESSTDAQATEQERESSQSSRELRQESLRQEWQANEIVSKSTYGYVESDGFWKLKSLLPFEQDIEMIATTYESYVSTYKKEFRKPLMHGFTLKGHPGEEVSHMAWFFKIAIENKDLSKSFLNDIYNAKRSIVYSFHTFGKDITILEDQLKKEVLAVAPTGVCKKQFQHYTLKHGEYGSPRESSDRSYIWYDLNDKYAPLMRHEFVSKSVEQFPTTIFCVQEDYKHWDQHAKMAKYGKEAAKFVDLFFSRYSLFVMVQYIILDDVDCWHTTPIIPFALVNTVCAFTEDHYFEELMTKQASGIYLCPAFWFYVLVTTGFIWLFLWQPFWVVTFCIAIRACMFAFFS
jgi:hypothetical protein